METVASSKRCFVQNAGSPKSFFLGLLFDGTWSGRRLGRVRVFFLLGAFKGP